MSDSPLASRAPTRIYPTNTPGKTPLAIMLLLILVIMVPIEFSFYVGSLFITASRAYLIVLFFMILPRLGTLKLRYFDWFFIGHVGWTCVSNFLIYPPGRAIEMSGSYILEMLIVYLAVRIFLRTVEQMRAMIRLLFAFVVIAGLIALPEALTGIRYAHEFASALTGIVYRIDMDMRMGITRAASLFEHPILYGIFCSSLLSMMWFTSTPLQRLYKTPLIAAATWLSASSAPFLILLIQILMLFIERLTRKWKRRDLTFATILGAAIVALETFTGRGLVGVLALLTLNPSTAYTRRSQWNYAIDDVMRNFWFGFVPSSYTRPFWLAPSIDNWWLLIMMRSGVPALILLALSALFLWIAISQRSGGPPLFNQLRTGWMLTFFALILGAATVTFFGKLQPLFAFYMGFGAALATCVFPKKDALAETAPAGRGGIAYTRFPRAAAPQPASTLPQTGPPARRETRG